ncbi:MAG: VIT1/CCC1 transporter family protein [Promethearchaeota archaeon]
MRFKKNLDKWKNYGKISELGIIARRKFFNNCFDGALTCAGIVSGMFISYLAGTPITSRIIVITGLATALAIGISGIWGAFLSEEAERKKKMIDLKKEMVVLDDEIQKVDNVEIQKAMVGSINIKYIELKNIKKKREKEKSIIQKAENFATIIASLVDGLAPVLGSVLPLIPFFIGLELSYMHFIFSYIILAGLLIYLGVFLGNISGGRRVYYAVNLVVAGVVTLIITLILGQFT